MTDREMERAAMVERQIARRGVRDKHVLEAMRSVPRETFVDPGMEFVGPDAISTAVIYNTQTVELVGAAAILDTPDFLDPLDDGDDSNGDETPNGDEFNRPAFAQTFEEIASGETFTAVVNHFKSKGSLTGAAADEDQGDGAGNNNATRTASAQVLLDWLATDPTGSGDRLQSSANRQAESLNDVMGGAASWENVARTSGVVCSKCGHNEAFFHQVQTRSADEPMTEFYKCVNCGHKWKE